MKFLIALLVVFVMCASVDAGLRKNRKQRNAGQKILHPFKHCNNGVCNLN